MALHLRDSSRRNWDHFEASLFLAIVALLRLEGRHLC